MARGPRKESKRIRHTTAQQDEVNPQNNHNKHQMRIAMIKDDRKSNDKRTVDHVEDLVVSSHQTSREEQTKSRKRVEKESKQSRRRVKKESKKSRKRVEDEAKKSQKRVRKESKKSRTRVEKESNKSQKRVE